MEKPRACCGRWGQTGGCLTVLLWRSHRALAKQRRAGAHDVRRAASAQLPPMFVLAQCLGDVDRQQGDAEHHHQHREALAQPGDRQPLG
jgi:hypothetical protein